MWRPTSLMSHPPAEYFRGSVRRGDLGAKSGRGFYDWSFKSAAEAAPIRDEFLVEVLLYRRRNRAVRKPPQGPAIRELPDRELPG
ncbi:MAG TPA: hypothetical protein VME43_19890 [Bryobacteraceae bacterium]|nr:hypothetical protein [Bryobacteraceae bacterium]